MKSVHAYPHSELIVRQQQVLKVTPTKRESMARDAGHTVSEQAGSSAHLQS